MGWVNYHGHCHYCDGNGKPVEYVEAAIDKGMVAIGFSSHAPVPFESFWNMKKDRLSEYVAEINQLKLRYAGHIPIHLSLEIDYLENVMGPSDTIYNEIGLDYTIGSVHFVGQYHNGEHWTIDGSYDSFKKGLGEIYNGDVKRLVKDFFRLQRHMITEHQPTIVGHFDKIKMHNLKEPFFRMDDNWYLDEVRQFLELVAQNDTIVEINTKSFGRNGLLFPGKEHFKWLKELAIPIVINSDAHYPSHLDAGFREVAIMLKDSGINDLAFLQDSKWNLVGFNEAGIII
ncbi:MAG: histidinol-phosphatase [Breznakibacter sp.]